MKGGKSGGSGSVVENVSTTPVRTDNELRQRRGSGRDPDKDSEEPTPLKDLKKRKSYHFSAAYAVYHGAKKTFNGFLRALRSIWTTIL